jgi:uncharacterized protein (TIGR03435 family)
MRYSVIPILFAATIAAQSFEVDAIKPHDPKVPCAGADLLSGGRFIATCWPLKTLIFEAYDILPSQISGGPAWINTDLWDITAKADGIAGEIPKEQLDAMLRSMIKERFHAALRVEIKELPGLVLLVARNGPKLTSNRGEPFAFDLTRGPALTCRKVTMAQFAAWLKSFTGAGRTVIDKTGLTGEYDFTLKWTGQPLKGKEVEDSDSGGPTIFTALQEQLGLRLVSQKVPTNRLVVERAERPEGN